MSYITCSRNKSRHKVHVSVCERCKGMDCPDYRNYVQLSLFPSMIPDEAARRKFHAGRSGRDAPKLSEPPEQMSWLEKPDRIFSG